MGRQSIIRRKVCGVCDLPAITLGAGVGSIGRCGGEGEIVSCLWPRVVVTGKLIVESLENLEGKRRWKTSSHKSRCRGKANIRHAEERCQGLICNIAESTRQDHRRGKPALRNRG